MRGPDRPPDARNRQRGVALVIVLLVLSLLLAVVSEFALAMRLEGLTTLNFRAAVSGNLLAEAAYNRALAEIIPDAIAEYPDESGLLVFRHSRAEVPRTPKRQDLALGPGRFSYRIMDEEARINLNRATPAQLDRLLQELDIPKDARDVITDSVQDWRDPDEEHRLNGAESDYYLALPVPYKSKNADFDSVEELLLVHGVTPQIFYGTPDKPGLAEYLTVAGTGQINLNTASDVVLRTLGLAQAEVDLLKGGRPYLDAASVPSNLRGRIGTMRLVSMTFRIDASGEVPGQGRRRLRAIVQRPSAAPMPPGSLRLLSWQWLEEEAARP